MGKLDRTRGGGGRPDGASGGIGGRLRRALEDRRGGALLLCLLVTLVFFGVAAMATTMMGLESRMSSNHQRGVAARYFAEGMLDRVVGLQNDLTATPRYLFDADVYTARAAGPADTTRFADRDAVQPTAEGGEEIGTLETRILGKDPVTESPPYTLEATAALDDGSSTTFRVVVDVVSLLDFAVFSDDDIAIAPDVTVAGRVYSAGDIGIVAPTATFLRSVEYVGSLQNPGYGDFRQGYQQIQPLQSIPDLVDLSFFEDATKAAGVCGEGRGLYIGTDGSPAVDAQTEALFRASEAGPVGSKPAAGYESDEARAGCRDGNGCYAIDLTLFDFSASPITYGGTPLVGYDGQPLTDFNGVIWSDGEVHVWGHLGGRSPEDLTVTDGLGYMTPPFVANNEYSNDVLDLNEDGSGGGVADGLLDPAGRGANVGIYADGHLYIDHNVWAGTAADGTDVRVALVARRDIRIDSYSPKTIVVEAAILSVTESWRPQGDVEWKWQGGWTLENDSHQDNDWANNAGDSPPNTYKFDLDGDGTLEGNNGANYPNDQNENNVRWAWTLRNVGNLVVNESPHSGPWSQPSWKPHPRFYTYDTKLQTAEIPCYPTLPDYGMVPGSFTEVTPTP